MKAKNILCSVCGVSAKKGYIEGKPWLEIEERAMKRCVEPSMAPKPFCCPNMLTAAMDAGLVGKDGCWIGWGTNAA